MSKILHIFSIIVFFSFFSILCSAQNKGKNCWYYVDNGEYQKAIAQGEKSIQENPNNADDYACLGASYRMLGSFKKAIFYLKKAEDLSKNAILQNLISNQLGTTYLNLENYDKALYYYNKQLQISKEGEAEALNNMAFVYQSKGDLDNALKLYKQSLILTKDNNKKASITSSMGVVYFNKEDYKSSLNYLSTALNLREKIEDWSGIRHTMINMGNVYRKLKDYNNALKYINEGLRRVKIVGEKKWEARGYWYLGLLYKDMGKEKKSKENMEKARKIYKMVGINETM